MKLNLDLELPRLEGLPTLHTEIATGTFQDGTEFRLGMAINHSALYVFTDYRDSAGRVIYVMPFPQVLHAAVQAVAERHGPGSS